jgi:hypothetical protein
VLQASLNLTTEQLYAVLLAAAALLLAAGGGVAWWRRRPKDPAEIERQRCLHLNRIGRIVEGHIVEIEEEGQVTADPLRVAPAAVRGTGGANGHGRTHRRVVFYRYSISGVTYETAQDISCLEVKFALDALVAGQPISVKYDPAHPSNSILMAEDWSGLH